MKQRKRGYTFPLFTDSMAFMARLIHLNQHYSPKILQWLQREIQSLQKLLQKLQLKNCVLPAFDGTLLRCWIAADRHYGPASQKPMAKMFISEKQWVQLLSKLMKKMD